MPSLVQFPRTDFSSHQHFSQQNKERKKKGLKEEPEATMMFDLISRKSMLETLCRIPGGEQVFANDGRSLSNWWRRSVAIRPDVSRESIRASHQAMGGWRSTGTAHCIGVNPGDAERDGERLFAFHDDLYAPIALAPFFQECMTRDANIRVHLGKIKVWNAGGIRPRACDVLQQIAEAAGSRPPVWRGSGLPPAEQGIKVCSCQ